MKMDPEEYLASLRADLSKANCVQAMMHTDGWTVYAEALDLMANISQQKFMREEIPAEQHRAELKAINLMRQLGTNLVGTMERTIEEAQKIETQIAKRKGLRHRIGLTKAALGG